MMELMSLDFILRPGYAHNDYGQTHLTLTVRKFYESEGRAL